MVTPLLVREVSLTFDGIVMLLFRSGIDKMTEKSPASNIHSAEPPVAASFDAADAAAAADDKDCGTADQSNGAGGVDDGHAEIAPPATGGSSPKSSRPTPGGDGSETAGGDDVDQLKLSTLKELAVVSRRLSLYNLYSLWYKT